MSIYFDFETINELTEDDHYRQFKEFSLKDLSQYNGSDGNPAYVAMEGIVYDISNTTTRSELTHLGITAGQDLTSEFNSCRGIVDIITSAPRVGVLIDDDYMSGMNNMNFRATMPTNTQVKQDTSKFTPDEWIGYIEPQEAITQVQEWQNTGASQLLKSGTSTGSAATSGSLGTGTTGIGASTGTSGITGMERITVLPPCFTTFKFVSDGIDIEESTGKSGNMNKSNRLYFD